MIGSSSPPDIWNQAVSKCLPQPTDLKGDKTGFKFVNFIDTGLKFGAVVAESHL